ncbi:MAG: hypothetical protein EOP67_22610, partial [Sphingomonas sp.]
MQTVLDGATNLLRPHYDRFGNLWLVDAAPDGAVVHVITDGTDRVVAVRGISGQQISSFTVTRDGASLVAALGSGSAPALLVSSLVRYVGGPLARAEPARRVPVNDADLATVVDLAQDSATGVVVLTRSPSQGDL